MVTEFKYPYSDWIKQGLDLLLEPRQCYSAELRAAIDDVEKRFAHEDVELVSIEHQVRCTKEAFEEGYEAGLKAGLKG